MSVTERVRARYMQREKIEKSDEEQKLQTYGKQFKG